MESKTELSRKWRKAQRDAGRLPRLFWLDAEECGIVKNLIDRLKKLRKVPKENE